MKTFTHDVVVHDNPVGFSFLYYVQQCEGMDIERKSKMEKKSEPPSIEIV